MKKKRNNLVIIVISMLKYFKSIALYCNPVCSSLQMIVFDSHLVHSFLQQAAEWGLKIVFYVAK